MVTRGGADRDGERNRTRICSAELDECRTAPRGQRDFAERFALRVQFAVALGAGGHRAGIVGGLPKRSGIAVDNRGMGVGEQDRIVAATAEKIRMSLSQATRLSTSEIAPVSTSHSSPCE